MQPQTAADDLGRREDGFKPKYRHFPPTDRVWVKNPFQHDVVYQVADEYNRPFRYRLPCKDRNGNLGCVSELPGGAIATLGVKAIVDELIQNSAEDNLLMWDERIRTKHEKQIIVQVRSTTPKADAEHPGEVNLASSADELPPQPTEAPDVPEEAFPGLNEEPETPPAPSVPPPAPSVPPTPATPGIVAQGIGDVVAASLPSSNVVVGANNAGHQE